MISFSIEPSSVSFVTTILMVNNQLLSKKYPFPPVKQRIQCTLKKLETLLTPPLFLAKFKSFIFITSTRTLNLGCNYVKHPEVSRHGANSLFVIITARIRRMGKVLFLQVSVCPPLGRVPHLHPIILPMVPSPFQGVPQ